jgi:hypothetical protein
LKKRKGGSRKFLTVSGDPSMFLSVLSSWVTFGAVPTSTLKALLAESSKFSRLSTGDFGFSLRCNNPKD